jgi:amino acid adenylation domain-containing protein
LSYAQEQVWLHIQRAPHLPLYNEPVTIHYRGPLDRAILERSFNEILRRHEAWRTSFRVVEGQPIQVVHPSLAISLPITDLRDLPSDQRDEEAVRIATQDARTPLDLERVPLFRARLVRLEEEEFRLYLTLSHIIFDGVAMYQVFLPELAALYAAFSASKPSPLPELPVQFPDFACWQRRCLRGESFTEDIAYWRQQLGGQLPSLYLPVDRAPAGPQTFRGSMYPFSLSPSLTTALRAFCQTEGVSLFHTLLAGFAALLYRYSEEEEIPIGSVTAGRNFPETEKLLGYFLNTVVFRADLRGDPPFRQLVERIRNTTIEMLEHDSFPFALLLRELQVPRDAGHNPLFQVLFSLEPPLPELPPAWRLTQMDIDTGATKYDLYLELDERGEEVWARFHYSTDLFDMESIVRMANHWRTLLKQAAADPGRRLSELRILTGEETNQLLGAWNETHETYPERSVHELFESQVERTPQAVAMVFGDSQLTYRELNERANQLAWHLRKRGVGPEALVGLSVERSLEMVIGLLGILKAGGAYVSLDPDFPEERLSFMLSDAKPRALLTQERLCSRFADTENVVLLDADWGVIAKESRENPVSNARPENLAYVIYTSGSTGKPKGVQIEHHSLSNLLLSMQREPGLDSQDVLVAVTTLSFDIAGMEVFLPLISGARLVVASSSAAGDGRRLRDLLEGSGATVMQATPTTWRLLIEAGWKGQPKLKVLSGGEALGRKLGQELARRSSSVWNLYGPTETAIWSSLYRLQGEEQGAIPIGRPIANTQILVLDSHQNLVPVNVTGEMYIGGGGVARGYLNQPAMTAERFVLSPFSKEPGERLYKTGDKARRRADGDLEYLGRSDWQVKIRGLRIELGEIETVLGRHEKVRQCVVVAREDSPGDKALVAYFEARDGTPPTASDLRAHLRKLLPDYMLPSAFVLMGKLPVTSNGKIDRRGLPFPAYGNFGTSREFAPPRTKTEKALAAIWKEVLKVERVGIHDDFFELGGNSLVGIQLIMRMRKVFGVELSLATQFDNPTIAALAAEIDRMTFARQDLQSR